MNECEEGDSLDAVARDVAMQLCAEIRQECRGKSYTFAAMQCWGCTTFTGGDPAKMCLSGKPGYRGCSLINGRYDRQRAGP